MLLKRRSILTLTLIATAIVALAARSAVAAEETTFRFFSENGSAQACDAIAFSRDNSEVAISTAAGRTVIYRISGSQLMGEVPMRAQIIGFSDNGRRLVLATAKNAVLWDRDTKQTSPVRTAKVTPGYLGVTIAQSNGKTLVDSMLPGSPAAKSGQLQAGDEILAIGRDSRGRWNSILGQPLNSILKTLGGAAGTRVDLKVASPGAKAPKEITLTRSATRDGRPQGEYIDPATLGIERDAVWRPSDSRIELVSPTSGTVISMMWSERFRSARGVLSPNAQRLAVAGDGENNSVVAEVFDTRTGQPTVVKTREWRCNDLCFSPNGDELFSVSPSRVVRIALPGGEVVGAYNHEGPVDLKTHPELYFAGGGAADRVFDFQQFGGGFRWRVVKPGTQGRDVLPNIRHLQTVAASSLGILAIGTAKGEISLLAMPTGMHLMTLHGSDREGVESLVFSYDGRKLAYFVKGTLHIVDLSEEIDGFRKHRQLEELTHDTESGGVRLRSSLGFHAVFPTRPSFDSTSRRYFVESDNGNLMLDLAAIDASGSMEREPMTEAKRTDIYDTLATSLKKNSDAALTMNENETLEGVPVRRVRWKIMEGGVPREGMALIALSNKSVFVVHAIFSADNPELQQAAQRFLDSVSFSTREDDFPARQ